MNHRRALRSSTDSGLIIFLIMIFSVVLWTTDEVLGWNLLPDWIDKYEELLVIILSILAVLSVVISIMCSAAVTAESAAERAGIPAPAPSRRARLFIALGVVMSLGIMFCLHKVDQYRAGKKAQEIQAQLQNRVPEVLALFTPETKQMLTGQPSQEGDEAVARLLHAIRDSTPFEPSVSVMVAASPPYTHCVIKALPQRRYQSPTDDWEYLRRRYLTGFPSDWERDALQAGFEGNEIQVPRRRDGVFINTYKPSGWGTLDDGDRVIGVVMLRGTL